MRAFHTLGVLLGAAVLAASAQAAGLVQVKFIQPEKFTDLRDANLRIDDNLKALQQVIEEVAARHVAYGQTLRIEVLDVDLAGEIKPLQFQDKRVLRGRADWPRIDLRYTLETPGAAARSGQARIADMAYLNRLPPSSARFDVPLAYEHRMLEEWFRAEFKPH